MPRGIKRSHDGSQAPTVGDEFNGKGKTRKNLDSQQKSKVAECQNENEKDKVVK